MISQKTKKLFFPILVAVFFLFVVSSLPAKADAWGMNLAAASLKQVMEVIYTTIQGAIKGALKQAAVEMINDTIGNMMSGAGGTQGTMFITNWDDELIYAPAKKTDIYMDKLLKARYKGRSSDYRASGQGEGVQANYFAYMDQTVRGSLKNSSSQANVYDSCKDPMNPFAQEDMRCWMEVAGMPMNDVLEFQQLSMATYEQEQTKAITQAEAYNGFKARKSGDYVITPGSTLQDIQSQTEDIGNKILANATSIPEIITSVVTRLVTKTINQGIGNVQRSIQKEINNTVGNVQQDITNQMQTFGPASYFMPVY